MIYLKDNPGNIIEEDLPYLIYDYTTVPRVDIMWYNPKQYNNIEVKIPIYMTDWYMREYNLDDDSLDFTLNVELDGVTTTYNNMKAGEHEVNLGILDVGNTGLG